MGYYRMLLVIFVVLILSVAVQGTELFKDPFFAVAYVIMGFVLFLGTKYKPCSRTSFAIGLTLILSIGFLSTDFLIKFFTGPFGINTLFKLSIVLCLDVCALFFLHYGRGFRREEMKEKRLGQYGIVNQEA